MGFFRRALGKAGRIVAPGLVDSLREVSALRTEVRALREEVDTLRRDVDGVRRDARHVAELSDLVVTTLTDRED